jgi:hypothetical protein
MHIIDSVSSAVPAMHAACGSPVHGCVWSPWLERALACFRQWWRGAHIDDDSS